VIEALRQHGTLTPSEKQYVASMMREHGMNREQVADYLEMGLHRRRRLDYEKHLQQRHARTTGGSAPSVSPGFGAALRYVIIFLVFALIVLAVDRLVTAAVRARARAAADPAQTATELVGTIAPGEPPQDSNSRRG
jgi:hypothetical protein